ncbi:MAG: hypothetical protein WCH57_10515, partial [Verrucomicrobiota bacterium]
KLQLAPAKRRPVLASSIKTDNALWWDGLGKTTKPAEVKKPAAPSAVQQDDYSFYQNNEVTNPDLKKNAPNKPATVSGTSK